LVLALVVVAVADDANAAAADDDDGARADEDAGDDRTVARRDRMSHPNSLLYNVLADAWRTRSVESASDSARIRPKTAVDGGSSRCRRPLFDIRARGGGGDGGDD